MKIINKTKLQTRNLKTFLVKVMERELLGPEFSKQLVATFRYRRRTGEWSKHHCSGLGWYGIPKIEICIPKDTLPDKRDLALVIAHEFCHNQNVKHGAATRGPRYGWGQGWEEEYAWAESLELSEYTTLPPVTVDKDALKLKHCQAQLKEWEQKSKLAKTMTSKWKEKLKYYQAKVSRIPPVSSTSDPLAPEINRAASNSPAEQTVPLPTPLLFPTPVPTISKSTV